jgi:hypothetical protein
MAAVRVVLVIVGCALLGTACGGTGTHSSSSVTATAGRISASAEAAGGTSAAVSDVGARLLKPRELRGFTPLGQRQVGLTAASWVALDQSPAAETAYLKGLGFVLGGRQDLVGPDRLAGLSMVEKFRSPGGARQEFAMVLHGLQHPGARAFAVSDVPGARGYYAAGSGINAVFSDGSYCYLVGAEEPPPGTASVTTRASVIAAVQRLYRRVHD